MIPSQQVWSSDQVAKWLRASRSCVRGDTPPVFVSLLRRPAMDSMDIELMTETRTEAVMETADAEPEQPRASLEVAQKLQSSLSSAMSWMTSVVRRFEPEESEESDTDSGEESDADSVDRLDVLLASMRTQLPPLKLLRGAEQIGETSVLLHIYHLEKFKATNNCLVAMAAFHSGLQVYGLEWSWGRQGVQALFPRTWSELHMGSINLGEAPGTQQEVAAVVEGMRWPGRTYALLSRNGCSWCKTFGACDPSGWLQMARVRVEAAGSLGRRFTRPSNGPGCDDTLEPSVLPIWPTVLPGRRSVHWRPSSPWLSSRRTSGGGRDRRGNNRHQEEGSKLHGGRCCPIRHRYGRHTLRQPGYSRDRLMSGALFYGLCFCTLQLECTHGFGASFSLLGRPGVILGNLITAFLCCSWRKSEWRAGLGSSWVAHFAVRVPDWRFTAACFLADLLILRLATVTCHGTIQLDSLGFLVWALDRDLFCGCVFFCRVSGHLAGGCLGCWRASPWVCWLFSSWSSPCSTRIAPGLLTSFTCKMGFVPIRELCIRFSLSHLRRTNQQDQVTWTNGLRTKKKEKMSVA